MAGRRGSGHLMIIMSTLVVLLLVLIPVLVVADHVDHPESATTLAARLKTLMVVDVDDGAAPAPPSYCWESLVRLQSCTGEAIMFFLNGEAYLGEACCTAIRTVARQCWPDMLQALGFTAAEGDMLEDYCDHNNDHQNNNNNINNDTADHYSLDDHQPPNEQPAAANSTTERRINN